MDESLKKDLGTIATAGSLARSKEQHEASVKAIETGKCPFCPPYEFKLPYFLEGKYWSVKHNDFPYEGHSRHLVFVFHEHTNDISRVSPQAWIEFGNIFRQQESGDNCAGGALVMRFGLSDFNASTVRHLHAHYQEINYEIAKNGDRKKLPKLHFPKINDEFPKGWEHGSITEIGGEEGWLIKRMLSPSDNLLERFMLFSKIPDTCPIRYLGYQGWEALGAGLNYCIEKFSLPGGGIVIPFGPQAFNSRITTRIYAEILVPKGPNMNVRAEFVPGFYRAGATFSKDPSRKKVREKRSDEFSK